jgi:hypothetical protein
MKNDEKATEQASARKVHGMKIKTNVRAGAAHSFNPQPDPPG